MEATEIKKVVDVFCYNCGAPIRRRVDLARAQCPVCREEWDMYQMLMHNASLQMDLQMNFLPVNEQKNVLFMTLSESYQLIKKGHSINIPAEAIGALLAVARADGTQFEIITKSDGFAVVKKVEPGFSPPERRALYDQCFQRWGYPNQMRQVAEECLELALAIRKNERGGAVTDILEETADVEIMVEQVRRMYGDNEINEFKKFKLNRLIERVNSPKKK